MFIEDLCKEDKLETLKEGFENNFLEYFNQKSENFETYQIYLHKNLCELDENRINLLELFNELFVEVKNETIKEYINNLENKQKRIERELINITEEKNNIIEKILKYQNRSNEWEEIYYKIPWYIRLLNKFNIFKQKTINKLNLERNIEEIDFLIDIYKLEDIQKIYIDKIDQENNNKNSKEEIIDEKNNQKDKIERKIKKIKNILNEIVNILKNLKEYNDNIDLNIIFNEEINIEKINEYLDSRIRYVEFWLAVHYYECRWLNEMYETINKELNDTKTIDNKLIYDSLAMLTPCMVMTFYVLPKNFKEKQKNGNTYKYLYNYIDYLIVDEAGQVSPEIAAASFALAKKALVVGDEKQIPPVWSISEGLDEALANSVDIINSNLSFEDLKNFGQNCSSSSVMKIAKNKSFYDKFDDDKGLFLKEHRRCYNEIIEYCNALVYNNKLEPCRGKGIDDEKYPIKEFPHMGYYNISVSNSDIKGSSRINEKEAEAIIEWLSENAEYIMKKYNVSDLGKILGIITPFKAQETIIKNKIKNISYLKNISVGTVHTFQGAERNIIILSTVYGSKDGCFFINQNDSLMNVAVSRAKDAFLVFGDRNCLDNDSKSASGLLKTFTNNEIK